jgi:phosphate uptake regulator
MANENACMELELLERDLRAHGRFVVRLLSAATDAFAAQDTAGGELALGLGRDVRTGQRRIDAAAARLLRSRVSELELARRAVAARRVNDELQQIAELIGSIARLARPPAAGAPVPRGLGEIQDLAEVVRHSLESALRGIGRGEAVGPPVVIESRLANATGRTINAVAARSQQPGTREWGLRAMMTVRCLRRVCDHSARIAAQTAYPLATGSPEAVWHGS